ncbi:MAG: hypothetical protein B7Z12_14935, partial [Caulobacter vibrioides]
MPLLTLYQDHELADIAALVNSAYRGETATQGWTSESALLGGQRTDEASLRADLAAKPGSTILTFRNETWEKPFACAWIEPQADDVWYVGMITVTPERQAGGLGRAVLETCEAYARARGVPTVIDGEKSETRLLLDLVPRCDHAVFSEPGLANYAPGARPVDGLRKAIAEGCRAAAVTRGEKGTLWLTAEDPEPRVTPAFRVQATNTTGAGDVFHGA